MPGIDDEIDRLFGLPLDEFTAARNDLARRLERDGDAEGAAAVQALPKPPVAVWTVNQLARHDADAVRALLDAGEALQAAQTQLLAGKDGSDSLRQATAQERAAVQALAERAAAVLQEAGRPSSQAMLDRVTTTLRAAAVDDEGRPLLEAGRLTAELDPAGFGGLAGTPAKGQRRTPKQRKPTAADRRHEREEEQRRRKVLRQEAQELERLARAAEREADKAEAAAEKARRRAEQARAEADAASREAP